MEWVLQDVSSQANIFFLENFRSRVSGVAVVVSETTVEKFVNFVYAFGVRSVYRDTISDARKNKRLKDLVNMMFGERIKLEISDGKESSAEII